MKLFSICYLIFITEHDLQLFLFHSETLIQVAAAWEDLEGRREEFLKEKKVLAHLGFY